MTGSLRVHLDLALDCVLVIMLQNVSCRNHLWKILDSVRVHVIYDLISGGIWKVGGRAPI